MTIKTLVLIVLILLGLYWLLIHVGPLPFNHEQLGLYNHDIHRGLGIFFFLAAGAVWKFWRKQK